MKEWMTFDVPPPLTPDLADLKAKVGKLAQQIERSWFSIGLLYRDAVKRKLAQGSGYPNVDSFWINNLESVDLHQVRKYAKATKVYGPDIIKYGIEELDLYITWARILKIPLGADPGPQLVTWTLDGVDHQKPFSECTEKDLKNAIASVRHRPGHGGPTPGAKTPPLPDWLQALMTAVQKKADPILEDDATHELRAWVDTDVDADGTDEVLLRAEAHVFFEACDAIGKAAAAFYASLDPATGMPRVGKPRKAETGTAKKKKAPRRKR